MLLLLLAACDPEEPAAEVPAPADTAATVSEDEEDTSPPEDTAPPPEPVVCKADRDAPTSTLLFCLSGVGCQGCDSLIELVLEIEVACVLDAEWVRGEETGLTLLHYTDMVDLDHVAALIEDTEGSPYTITCVEEVD